MIMGRRAGPKRWAQGASAPETGAGAGTAAEVALFRDATETLFAIAERRRAQDPAAPAVPRRHFVRNADEAHAIAFEGPNPIVGMSLDDVLDCARSDRPNAGDLVVLAGVHRGFLQLMARPGLDGIAALTGRRIAVDTDTGYASALFEILRRSGLERGRDYEVVYAGATNLRYEKLLSGDFDATLLGAPFTRLAKRAGFASLGTVIGALGAYQAVTLVTRRPWLEANRATAQAVVRCLHETLAFARDPSHGAEVAAFVQASLPFLTAVEAAEVAGDLFGPGCEFLPDGRMGGQDVAMVLDLFNASRSAHLTPADVARLWDKTLPPA